MEVLESGEQSALQWDRKLSELSEPGDPEALTYPTVRTRRGRAGGRGGGVLASEDSWGQGAGMDIFGKRLAQNGEIWGEAWLLFFI